MRVDGERPDDMALVSWKLGQSLILDATCLDTLAPLHLAGTVVQADAVASEAEYLKRYKYCSLGRAYMFVPFGVDTLGCCVRHRTL